MTIARLALLTTLFTPAVFAAPLTVDTYNPQEKGIFAVSSTLVSGPKEAVLFDAQFSVKDGEALVEKIRHSGKTLNKIVITSGDPDFYFGLQPLMKASLMPKLSPRNRWWTISGPQKTRSSPSGGHR